MPVGLEVYNDGQSPQLINTQGFNFIAITSGTVSVPSNTIATGQTGFVALPAASTPYLVFIRCSGLAHAFGSTNRFSWVMAQGTTSFQYWVYGRPSASGNVGMQVFNPDGSLQWDCTQRPLQILGIVNKGSGSTPPIGQFDNRNVVTGPGWGGLPTNAAFLMSDYGYSIDVYVYTGGGNTIRGNMRFYPFISTPDANTLYLHYGRRRNNITSPGSNARYQGWTGNLPSFLIMASTW